MEVNQTVLTLTPGGNPQGVSLGYTAKSVSVDNYTSSYVNLPEAGKVIPAWVYGAVVPLPYGLRNATAALLPTVPAIPGPPVPISQAVLTWTDQALAPAPGQLMQQAQYGVTTVLDRFDTSLLATKTYTLPGGTASVGVGIDLNETTAGVADPVHSVVPASITLTGLPSGSNYLLFVPNAALRQVFWAAVNPEDTRLTVTTDGVHPNGCFVDVLTSPLMIAGQGGDQLGNLSVTLQRSLPALWEAPNLRPISLANVIVAGGNANLIPAVAGLAIRLFSLSVTVDAVGAAGSDLRFFDGDPTTTGTERGRIGTNVQPPPINFWGTTLNTSNGFFIYNGGAASVTVRGTLLASQG